MVAMAWMTPTITPAVIAAIIPIQGLPVKYVTAAAVKAPANIIPSSAILMTPLRSEYSPPSAARMRGVARRMVDAIKVKLKMSVIIVLEESLRNKRKKLGARSSRAHDFDKVHI